MPIVRSITVADDLISFVDAAGVTHTVTPADIPAQNNTPALVEAWLTLTFAGLSSDVKFAFHVWSLAPLSVQVLTLNSNLSPAANWWLK